MPRPYEKTTEKGWNNAFKVSVSLCELPHNANFSLKPIKSQMQLDPVHIFIPKRLFLTFM